MNGRKGSGGGRGKGAAGAQGKDGQRRPMFRRRKVCKFCADKIDDINYKDVKLLMPFVPERAKILPRRISGTCALHQRKLRTALMRADMPSQPEAAHFDRQAVHRATRIEVPALPSDWRILDAQVFPSDYGPSLQMVIDTGADEPVSLFAARTSADIPETPQTEVVDGQAVGFWSHDGTAYALSGDQPARQIAEHAEDQAD